MPNKSGSLGQGPLWIIASLQAGRLDVLTVDPDGDGGYLPIFSFEEEAETFLRLSGDDGKTGWRSREATSGELVSVLLAPCAEVKQVALDPLPLSFGGAMVPFVSVKRDRFVQDLMGERRGVAGDLAPRERVPPFTELPILRLLGCFPKDAAIRKECTEVCTDAKQDGCEH